MSRGNGKETNQFCFETSNHPRLGNAWRSSLLVGFERCRCACWNAGVYIILGYVLPSDIHNLLHKFDDIYMHLIANYLMHVFT